jgi:hypothetical protein
MHKKLWSESRKVRAVLENLSVDGKIYYVIKYYKIVLNEIGL